MNRMLVHLLLLLVLHLAQPLWVVAGELTADEIRQKRAALESKFEELQETEFEYFRRSRHQSLMFLKGHQFEAGDDPRQTRIVKLLGDKMLSLAKAAIRSDAPALAFDLLHEARYFHNPAADKIVGRETREPRVVEGKQTHTLLRWKRKSYYTVNTDHFQVLTQDARQGIELANRLEDLHTIWSQLFFTHWSTKARLSTCLDRESPLEPRATKRRRHKVVLFPDRESYVAFLAPRQPRIQITSGFYDLDSRTSFFFSGDDVNSTQLHEVTHQLFQELTRSSRRQAFAKNFWVIEGVAMYMESLRVSGPVAVVGGVHANRLQFARFRRIQEQFYVPLSDLAKLGRSQLQRDERIRRIYSQSAGLSHFLMDGKNGKLRSAFINFIRDVYKGSSDVNSLPQQTSTSFRELDAQYADFLRVEASDLLDSLIPPNSLRSLCLSDTEITDKSLSKLTQQANLDWLDLSRTKVTDAGLSQLQQTAELRQLSLDGTSISDASMSWISRNRHLEELDLSNTRITSRGFAALAPLSSLEILWLSNTRVNDKVVPLLRQLKGLKFLALEGTDVSDTGKQQLKQELPDLTIE